MNFTQITYKLLDFLNRGVDKQYRFQLKRMSEGICYIHRPGVYTGIINIQEHNNTYRLAYLGSIDCPDVRGCVELFVIDNNMLQIGEEGNGSICSYMCVPKRAPLKTIDI